MFIGERLRALREAKHLSQGDIEKRTGMLRCYVSRVEHGHTVPSLETLEKWGHALEIPLYRLFYDGEKPRKLFRLARRKMAKEITLGSSGKEARYWSELRRLLGRMHESKWQLILHMAQKMAGR